MIKEITVNVNLTKKPGNVAAVADATLDLGDAGTVKMCGFRVMVPDGKPAWVASPARKGEKTWFDNIILKGPVEKLVKAAILKEFERIKAGRNE